MAHNYNFSVQYELAKDNVITVGYSGQLGRDLALYRDLNASPLGSAGNFGDRPFATQFPEYNHIIQLNNDGQSHYDSLQMTYNQRNFHGFNNQANFTWSKCFDYNSVNRGGAGDYPQLNNPYIPRIPTACATTTSALISTLAPSTPFRTSPPLASTSTAGKSAVS